MAPLFELASVVEVSVVSMVDGICDCVTYSCETTCSFGVMGTIFSCDRTYTTSQDSSM